MKLNIERNCSSFQKVIPDFDLLFTSNRMTDSLHYVIVFIYKANLSQCQARSDGLKLTLCNDPKIH